MTTSRKHSRSSDRRTKSRHTADKAISKRHHHSSKATSRTKTHRRHTSGHSTSRRRHHTRTPLYPSYGKTHDLESGRHPNSSISSGIDTVLIIILTVFGISAVILLVLGIWLLASDNGWPVSLDNHGSVGWTRFISFGTACLIVGLLFIPLVVLSVLSTIVKHGAKARTYRLCVVFIASFCFVCLIMMTFTAAFYASYSPPFVADVINTAWKNTVTGKNTVLDACRIQNKYKCQGWLDNSCVNCRPTRNGVYNYPGSACTVSQRSICPRCWEEVSNTSLLSTSSVSISGNVLSSPPQEQQSPLQKTRRQTRKDVIVVRTEASFSKSPSPHSTPPPHVITSSTPSVASHPATATSSQLGGSRMIRGCRTFVIRRYRRFFVPMCVYTVFLSVVLILFTWRTCLDSAGR